jgi:hypothetical protein
MLMTEEQIDLRRLAEQAAREAYSPRAEFCWPWSHRWTMWTRETRWSLYQRRRCVRCGKTTEKLVF